jgi:uncharacterized membrane protein YqiK
MNFLPSLSVTTILVVVAILIVLFIFMKSIYHIPAGYNGWVTKSFGKKIENGGFLALDGEAGIQPDPIQNGWRFKLWPLFSVRKEPLVQIPAGSVGVVISQVGAALAGTKSAVYNPVFGDFEDVRRFMSNGGQQGVQRHILAPGATRAINPFAFIVVASGGVYGTPVNDEAEALANQVQDLRLKFVNVPSDNVGVVTTLDGPPLEGGDIAGRIGGFADIQALETEEATTAKVIDAVLARQNGLHSNYEDFQKFLDEGGRLGMQHDVLVPGQYMLNPFLVSVELTNMLVVEQGEVCVVKSFIGLPTVDSSGDAYKFGSIVSPGHQGIWSEPLRTGKYAINPHIYSPIKVPTAILQLNWADSNSEAHRLDQRLTPISAKSKDAFEFSIDLQVQIHVPDTKAARVIGSVGTMENLVNEVLQAAVGNYFRNTLSGMPATEFIETRGGVQQSATTYIMQYLKDYDVEVRGVYIQDVILPRELVSVLTQREIANQEKTTFKSQQSAQEARIELEAMSGKADMQKELAAAQVSVDINTANASAAVAQAEGERQVLEKTGQGEASKIAAIGRANGEAEEAVGRGKAAGYEAQRDAIGATQTAIVAALDAIGQGGTKVVPDTLIMGDGGGLMGLVQLLMTQATAPKAVVTASGEAAEVASLEPAVGEPVVQDGVQADSETSDDATTEV